MTPDLGALREAEYLQRLEVTRLRRLLYEIEDPASAGEELFEELTAAEDAHTHAEVARQAAEGADPMSGVIADSTEEPHLLGLGTTGLRVRLELRMEALPVSIAHLLDPVETPLVYCCIDNDDNEKTRRVRVRSYIEGYSAQAVDFYEIEPQAKKEFTQLPLLFADRARTVTEMTRAALNVNVDDLDGPVELHRAVPIWLLARSTAPLSIRNPATGASQDMTPYLGAFVTPNVVEVHELLHDAAGRMRDGQLVGYQKGQAEVTEQIKALFAALKEKAGITYVNSVISFSPDDGIAHQRVRLPRESLQVKSANCIDGTVLFASLIEAASMSPAIVTVPGHAFVAWETGRKTDAWEYLETTMIGDKTFEESCTAAKRTADHYSARGGSKFKRLPLRHLRGERGITPME